MGAPWTPDQENWRFRPRVLFCRRLGAVSFGAALATVSMFVLGHGVTGLWLWCLAAGTALMLGAGVMWLGLRWAQRPAFTISWDGLGWPRVSSSSLLPWSIVDSIGGQGPIWIKTRHGTVHACPWLSLDVSERQRLVVTLRQRFDDWGSRRPFNSPAARWQFATERLLVRPWSMADLTGFHRIYTDEALLSFQDYAPLDRYDARQRLNHIIRVEDRPVAYAWNRAIVEVQSGVVIGHLDLWVTRVSAGVARVGYGIFPEHQGQGLMTEVLQSVAPMAIEEWGFCRLEATVRAHNGASRQVLKKSNFRSEGEQEETGVELWAHGIPHQPLGERLKNDSY